MGYLEWSNEIRIVSSSGQKLAQIMFYWSKFGGILKLIKKAKTMILSLWSLKLPLGRCHILNLIHWKWLCVKDKSEIFKRWNNYSHEKSPWWKTYFLYFVIIVLWIIQMLLRCNFKTKVKCELLLVINFKFYVCQYKTISCSDIIINYWPFLFTCYYLPSSTCHWSQ